MAADLIDDNSVNGAGVVKRASVLLQEHQQSVYERTDRLFAALLIFQWLFGIVIALVVSPTSWAGRFSQPHIHLWTAIFFGGLLISWPVYLALKHPGLVLTRHTIAVCQMLFSILLIHLSGGRIETHFHVFGSLAFLAAYRDWRVLVSASTVVALGHVFVGLISPQSLYGVLAVEPWRWLEHIGWVVFEDVILIKACQQNVNEMQSMAFRRAEVENIHAHVEGLVAERTSELHASETRLLTQYAVTRALAEVSTLNEAAPLILRAMGNSLFARYGTVHGAFWQSAILPDQLDCVTSLVTRNLEGKADSCEQRADGVEQEGGSCAQQASPSSRLSQQAWKAGRLIEVLDVEVDKELSSGLPPGYCSAFAFPIFVNGEAQVVLEFATTQTACALSADEREMFESLGRQIGQFIVRKRAEEMNRKLADLVNSSTEAITSSTLDGVTTSWNGGAARLLGYSFEEIKAINLAELVPAQRKDEWCAMAQKSSRGELIEDWETIRQRKDGSLVEVSLTRSPLYDKFGTVVGVSEIARDITERKHAEKRVSEFYSSVSHELRSPLTSIRGALGLIEGGVVRPDSKRAQHLIEVARSSADRLIRLINDILDLKKIEEGMMALNFEPLDAQILVQDTTDALAGMAHECGIELICEVEPVGSLYGVRDLLVQVLTNLISNAIKFSERESLIRVVVSSANLDYARLAVIDGGQGIPAEEMHKLFRKFQQLDSSDSRAHGGTGLGLAISKAIVEEHLGQVGVESTVGAGSTFWFTIPFSKIDASPTCSTVKEPAAPKSAATKSAAIATQVCCQLGTTAPHMDRTSSIMESTDT